MATAQDVEGRRADHQETTTRQHPRQLMRGRVLLAARQMRQHVQGLVAANATRQERVATDRHVSRAVMVGRAVERDYIEGVARSIVKKVRKAGGELLRSTVFRNLSEKQRPVLDDAIDFAEERGWLTQHIQPSHTSDDERMLRLVE